MIGYLNDLLLKTRISSLKGLLLKTRICSVESKVLLLNARICPLQSKELRDKNMLSRQQKGYFSQHEFALLRAKG